MQKKEKICEVIFVDSSDFTYPAMWNVAWLFDEI